MALHFFPKLSARDRLGLALCALLLFLITLGIWWSQTSQQPLQTITVKTINEPSRTQLLRAKSTHKKDKQPALDPFPFNPNTADKATLLRLGLKEWQVKNLLKYRAAGGVWRSREHFAALYGLSAMEYQRLAPYIQLPTSHEEHHMLPERPAQTTLPYTPQPKLAEGTVLDLNTADTLQLKMIPGIGGYLARKIVKYRQRLGGFVQVSQLTEVGGIPESAHRWVHVIEPVKTAHVEINRADFTTMIRHPYLSVSQVKDILRYRRLYGDIKSMDQLLLFPSFTTSDVTRLQPYLNLTTVP